MLNFKEFKKTLNYSEYNDKRRKSLLSEFICYLVLVILFFYNVKINFDYNNSYTIINFSIMLITLVALLLYKRTNNYKILNFHINIFLTLFLMYVFFTGGDARDETALVWFPIFPLLTYPINGLIKGFLMNFIFLLIAVVGLFCSDFPFVIIKYPETMVSTFLCTSVFVSIMGFVMEYSRIKANMKEKKYKESLIKMSEIDSMTKIYNRRFMDNYIKSLCKNGEVFALVFADIDNFKKINDTYGHDVGDVVIKTIANTFLKSIRDVDTVSRWGGEEFLIILKEKDINLVSLIIERIRNKIESSNINNIKVTCSFGISFSKEGKNDQGLLKLADNRLYKAKGTGKNKIVCE